MATTGGTAGEAVGASALERRVLSEDEARAIRRGVPNPRVELPRVAVPTALLFMGSLTAWLAAPRRSGRRSGCADQRPRPGLPPMIDRFAR